MSGPNDDTFALSQGPESTGRRRRGPTQAERLADAAEREGELFHDEARTGYASFDVEGHRETWPIRSTTFRLWVTQVLWQQNLEVVAPSGQAVRDALATLEARALFRGDEHPVHRRVAGTDDGRIVLDLANEQWEAAVIGRDGWAVTDDPPVRFVRSDASRPLPHPLRGGSVDVLRPLLNIESEDAWRLVVGWIVMAFRPRGPYPVLALSGEQGAAKSTAGRLIRGLVDPSRMPDRTVPRDERDLAISARNGWILNLDNVSGLAPWLSDALARLSTGAGLSTRQLYTDADEVMFYAMRPCMLNGITSAVTRGDLLDRSLLVELSPLPPGRHRPEEVLLPAYDEARPTILGGLLDAVSHALRTVSNVRLASYPRMADFARWVVAAEPALDWPAGSFMAAYWANRGSAHEIALDASPVAVALRGFLGGDQMAWAGTASALLDALTAEVGEDVARRKTWPPTAKVLSDELRRLAPNLRALGLMVDFSRSHHPRIVRLARTSEGAGPSSPASPVPEPVPSPASPGAGPAERGRDAWDRGDAGGRAYDRVADDPSHGVSASFEADRSSADGWVDVKPPEPRPDPAPLSLWDLP